MPSTFRCFQNCRNVRLSREERPQRHKSKGEARRLKQKLACGGTVKEGVIVLQGDQRKNIRRFLVESGYPDSHITVLEGLQ